jgi:aminoglycoside 3-N-acetyltransferase
VIVGIADKGRRLAEGMRRRLDRARQKMVTLDQKQIEAALQSLGHFRNDLLLVHSSLSACGFIEGGPATVIESLRNWIGDGTALVMPTHTWSYPDVNGIAPVYDSRETSSLVGAITNHFWRQPGVMRSLHPSHSLAYNGSKGAAFCDGHELRETPCGRATPYERMVQANSSVLMFGATLDAYTLFHTAEDAASVPYLYFTEPVTLRTKLPNGTIQDVPSRRQDMTVARRFSAMAAVLEERGLLQRMKLGRSELLYIPDAAKTHSWIVRELEREPLLLVAESDREKVAMLHTAA